MQQIIWGARWRIWLRHCATSWKVASSIPDSVTEIFQGHNFFRPHYGPGVDTVSNRNKYQEYFLGGKGCRCLGLTTLPLSCADCLEIWEPQTPGTLRAYPGFTFTLPLYIYIYINSPVTLPIFGISVWHTPNAVCTVLNSWWWTERPSETCRVLFQNKINLRYCASGWFYYRNILRCTVLHTSKLLTKTSIFPTISAEKS